MTEPDEEAISRWTVAKEFPYQLFQSIEAGVYVTDDDGRIIAVNPEGERILARPAGDFLGADPHDLLHRDAAGAPVPRSECRLLQAFLAGQTAQVQAEWFARGDGSVLPVALFTAAYRTDGGIGGAVVLFFEYPPHEDTGLDAPEHISAARALADRLALVAETTTVLTSTLDSDEALRRLVRLVVPRLADWAIVDLIMETNELRRVAVAHYENGRHEYVDELTGPLPPLSQTSRMPLARVLRGGAPIRVGPQDYEAPPDTGLTVAQRELFEVTGIDSAIIASLRGLRDVLGALTLGRAEQRQPFTVEDMTLVDDIAHRAGLAVDNARLYDRQRRVAETMQRHLLPTLPSVGGLQMVARYLPAPHSSQVGGDWYDAFVLPDGTTALVIGDVVGHDLQAAAYMSQVRNMLRAFAWNTREPPSLVIDRLDHALVHISDAPMVTLVLGRIEGPVGGPWDLRWSNAGHPPPLLISDNGKARYLQGGHGMLLGTEVDSTRSDAVVALPPSSTLLFYTDGLVESPKLGMSEGLVQLRRHASSLVHRPLDDLCDELLRRALPASIDDDVALLALRMPELVTKQSAPSAAQM